MRERFSVFSLDARCLRRRGALAVLTAASALRPVSHYSPRAVSPTARAR